MIFTVFLIFKKYEQTSWFQIVEFIERIHAKLIGSWWGPNIHDIFDINFNDIIAWCLIGIDFLYDIYEIVLHLLLS